MLAQANPLAGIRVEDYTLSVCKTGNVSSNPTALLRAYSVIGNTLLCMVTPYSNNIALIEG